jgi:integrase
MGISLMIVKKDKKKQQNKVVYPIYVKYSYKGLSKRFSTNSFVELQFWKNGSLSNRCPNYIDIQKRITNKIDLLNEIVNQIEENKQLPTTTLVGDLLKQSLNIQLKKQPIKQSFWKCYDLFLKEKSMYHKGYTKTLDTLKNKLEIFENETKQILSFDYINDGGFEIDFKKFCWDTEIKRKGKVVTVGLSNNYINKTISNLKIFLWWCKENRYITDIRKFKSLKTIRNDELVFLNSMEVKKMFDYDKFNYPKTYENCSLIEDRNKSGDVIYWNNLELVKDIFTFQCSIGCRWGDIHKMKVGMFKYKDDYFSWTMEKTKSSVLVPQNPISKGIFMKYSKGKSLGQNLFPPYTQQRFNQHIKEIGKILKFNRLVKREIMVGVDIRDTTKKEKQIWELLSSHSGRRSFIKNLIDLNTMDNWSIMKLSGHKTINSFQKYVSVVDKDIDKGKKLYTKEFVKKDKDEYFEQLNEIPKDLIFDYLKNNFHNENE